MRPESHRRILFVYPKFPTTYWGMQYSLPLLGKKAMMPPLGLLTIAALTPPTYELRLIDLNCVPLSPDDLEWADMICLSAMLVQRQSLFEVASRGRAMGKLVVFGGPFATASPEECRPYCDVQVLNEAEVTWPLFLSDLARGTCKSIYTSEEKPDVTTTPVPRFDLIKIEDYAVIPVQFSRGCPFQCEFCDIIVMFGRRPRTKTPSQLCAELQALYDTGYRGIVFIVDDNFIGNKREVRRLLPELAAWNEAHGKPFMYGTEASVNLADDPDVLQRMVEANFTWVFLGIETPSVASLHETLKYQNTNRSLLESVKVIQNAGLLVFAGFIIGFDNDTEDIFDRQVEFIAKAAIPNAMVGLLMALPGTPLYKRMQETNRLKPDDDARMGDHCGYGYTNIVTALPEHTLLAGYRKVIKTLYTPQAYFRRSLEAFSQLPRPGSLRARVQFFFYLHRLNLMAWSAPKESGTRKKNTVGVLGLFVLLYFLLKGVSADYRRESLRFAWSILKRCPERFPGALGFVVIGVHLCRFSFEQVIPSLDTMLAQLPDAVAPPP